MNAHVRVLAREQLDDGHLAHDVVEHGQRVGARDLADLARDACVVAVHLDAAEAVAARPPRARARRPGPRRARACDEREAVEPTRAAGDDARDLAVGGGVVGVEGRRSSTVRSIPAARGPRQIRDRGGASVSHGPVRPSPLPAWQWQSMIIGSASWTGLRSAALGRHGSPTAGRHGGGVAPVRELPDDRGHVRPGVPAVSRHVSRGSRSARGRGAAPSARAAAAARRTGARPRRL